MTFFWQSRLPSWLCLSAMLLLGGCNKDQSPGKAVYGPNCAICHHGGDGMPGEVPPLVGRVDLIEAMPAGRDYLIDVLLNGLSGPITVRNEKYSALMPSFRRLDDEQIAAVINWLSLKGDTHFDPRLSAADIARARRRKLSPGSVWDERHQLGQEHPLP